VVTIVILSVSVAGVLAGIGSLTARSADPMITAQAGAIAEAYLEEILLRSFRDPEAAASDCTSSPGVDAGETRASYDDIDDYNGLIETARLQADTATTLDAYQVSVTVACADLETITAASRNAARVTVSVSRGGVQQVVLRGYRANL
jgi:MSHA pilin protein MshD